MAVSSFDLFKIGIGPSSSHTVGPMRAAARFVQRWLIEGGDGDGGELARTARLRAEVFGSLALTGRGHGTDKAVLMGLEGHLPNEIDPDVIPAALERIRGSKRIRLAGRHEIGFDEKHDLIMNKRQKLPFHTNGMRFTAFDAEGNTIATRDYYSVGGGFVVNQDEAAEDRIVADTTELPYPFHSGDELLARCRESGLSIAQLMYANEQVWRRPEEIDAGLDVHLGRDAVLRGARHPREGHAARRPARVAPGAGAPQRTVLAPGSGDARPAHHARLGQPLRAGGERGERRRRSRRHRAHQRRGRHHSVGAALLRPLLPGRERSRACARSC